MVDVNLSSKVELFICCRDLLNKDTFSKSDPFVVLFQQNIKTGAYYEVGRTETMKDNLNPSFKQTIKMDYFFEELQNLRFDVYDQDSTKYRLDEQDFLGEYSCTLADIVASPDSVLQGVLKNRRGYNAGKGRVIVRSEEVSKAGDILKITLRGSRLDKKDLFGSSDPYVQIYKHFPSAVGEPWQIVYQTETIMNNLNPSFKPFELSVQQLCNGDSERPILVRCFDYDKHSSHDLIGEFQTTLQALIQGPEFSETLVHPRKKKEKGEKYIGSGRLSFSTELVKVHSFLDYVQAGLSISLMVAIDFTGSNGDPSSPDSLHYRFGKEPNQYEKATRTIGDIIAPYDADQLFPVWGFGALLPNSREVNHCFPLNLSGNEVKGVQGIIDAYHKILPQVKLSGPTWFNEIIQTADSVASAPYSATEQHYNILLILTDGVINDMNVTMRSIIQASAKPLSIIIIGVGAADFHQMEVLDGDGKLLSVSGKTAQRDIVQFVPFRDFANRHISELAKETLAEIPSQVLSFMKRYDIAPLPRKTAAAVFESKEPPASYALHDDFSQLNVTAPAPGFDAPHGAPAAYDAPAYGGPSVYTGQSSPPVYQYVSTAPSAPSDVRPPPPAYQE